ncbi:MAG: FAD binding domain-containing protein [Caldimonas sp.]
MKAAPFDYLCAGSAAQAVAWLGESELAKACGGSQSLGPMLNLRLAQVDRLVDLSRIEALTGFALDDDVLRIGAAVTHARIEDGELPDCTRGLLPAVAAGIAYRAVRNRGTIGGSLAHADPAADWVNTMCLLDAGIVVLGPAGERRMRASAFFVGAFTTALAPDEIIVAVEVPRFSVRARWAYRKACRKPGEFSEATGAAWIDPERGVARAMLGALGSMPHVVESADALAALRRPGGVARALDDAGVDDPYEREVHAVMLRRALADLEAFA